MSQKAPPCNHLFPKEEIEQSIPDRFEKQVRKHQARLAISTPAGSLTYEELDSCSNRIANAMLACDAHRTEPVALLFEQDSPLIAAILGVLKTGNIYVPLDTNYSKAQHEHILADSGASLILTDAANFRKGVALADERLKVIEVGKELRSFSSGNPSRKIAPDTLAYIYYTSGSTGKPKGVVDDHRNILHNVMRYTNNLRITHDDRLTLLQSSGFSGAVSNIFGSLLNGAALFPIDLRRIGIGGLADCIRSEGITIYHSVPTIFQRLLTGGREFRSLRVIRLEGDRATLKDLELFQKHFDHDCLLVNGLGATETGITRQYFADARTIPPGAHLPVGFATEDMQALLLDEKGDEVSPGEVGEIAIRSRYLARGYWRQPKLTRARFVDNPDSSGERTYLSGDLGRFGPDGELVFLGRKDLRQKFNGEWLDTEKIELELDADDTIEHSLVEVRTSGRGTDQVVAYYVAVKGAVISTSGLRRKLVEAGFEELKIPTAFVRLKSIPLDANGKVSRQNLPEPRQALRPPYEPVRTETERRVAEAFGAVLGYARVGRLDDFYTLGGDSLDVVSVSLNLETSLSSTLPLALFAHATTVEKLARAIDTNVSARSLVALQPDGCQTPFFCVHAHMGHVINLRNLAMRLGSQRPFYALQLRGLDRQNQPPASMTEMARQYVSEIRTAQKVGPYMIGGYCYGGIVAVEMVRLLQQAGESVSILALIDTDCPVKSSTSAMRLSLGRIWQRVVYGKKIHWRNVLRNYGSHLVERTKTAALRFVWRHYVSRKQSMPRILRNPESLLKMIEMEYDPRPIQCNAVVLVATEDQAALPTEESWSNIIKGELEIRQIPVSASELLREPQVGLLAEILASRLDEQ